MIARVVFITAGLLFLSLKETAAQSVKLAVITGTKSVLAGEAEEIVNGVTLALSQSVNETKPKYTLEAEFKDNQLKPDITRQILTKLKTDQHASGAPGGINYVIGLQTLGELVQVSDLAKNRQIVVISPAIRSDQSGMQNDFIFRTRHTQKQEADFFSKYIFKAIGRAALSSVILDSDAGATQIKMFKPAYDNLGGRFGLFEDLYLDRPDYQSLMQRLKGIDARSLYILGLSVQVADIMTEATFAAQKLRFFGSSDNHSQLILDRAGAASEGFTIPYTFDFESNPASVTFAKEYQNKFNKMPSYIAANAYDSVRILSTCIEKVGDNPAAVKSCLYYIRDFDGAGGKFSIDRNGNSRKEFFIKTVQDGKFVKVD